MLCGDTLGKVFEQLYERQGNVRGILALRGVGHEWRDGVDLLLQAKMDDFLWRYLHAKRASVVPEEFEPRVLFRHMLPSMAITQEQLRRLGYAI
jgi:hypothetical protein